MAEPIKWITINGKHVPIYEDGMGRATQTTINTDDDLNGIVGTRYEVPDVADKIEQLHRESSEGAINPHYRDENQKGSDTYRNNCSICTVATMMQALGYDVEAGTQVPGYQTEPSSIFTPDLSDPNDYLIPNTDSYFDLNPHNIKAKLTRCLNTKTGKAGPDLNADVENLMSRVNYTPRGAKKVAEKITGMVEKWPDGAFGEISITWKSGSSHSMFIFNQHGKCVIFDSQSNTMIQNIEGILSRTRANNTQVVRYDNFLLYKAGGPERLQKVLKVRNKK